MTSDVVLQEEVRGGGGSGVEERLLLEVRRRLQQARGQLNSAPPSEADHTPLDSPMGGRPTVLQVLYYPLPVVHALNCFCLWVFSSHKVVAD